MKIEYLGHSSFKISTKDATVVADPFDPDKVGLTFPKVQADVVLSSHDHFDHRYLEGVSGEPFIIDAPGEYEVGGIKVRGFKTFHDDKEGKERGTNTVFLLQVEDVTLLHLGDLGHVLSERVVEEIGELNVLFVPVGGVYTIGAEDAAKVAAQLEPNYIVPMHYLVEGMDKTFGDLQPVSAFLEEMGIEEPGVKKELSISSKGLPEESEVVVLARTNG
ncbi:hypothetical protein GTO10_06005 [Candidatus Saccharibacteria bacterium]|nr:hypothetical protein [Candidatus Saccharibacteria bacterium]